MDALKKWIIIRFTPYTKPTPNQNECSPKTFVQIILAAKWLVLHSSTTPKQQRRPFPFLLSLYFLYSMRITNTIGTGTYHTVQFMQRPCSQC